MSAKNIDYSQLKAIMPDRVNLKNMPKKASLANAISALNDFLRERKILPSAIVGTTLRLSFYGLRTEHLAVLRALGRSLAYLKARKNLLGYWHNLVAALDHEAAVLDRVDTPFQSALFELMDGRKHKPTCRLIGLSPAALTRWKQGGTPRPGAAACLTRLEELTGRPPGYLTDRLPHNPMRRLDQNQNGVAPIAYRVRHALLMKDRYLIKPKDALPSLIAEWRALLAWRTTLHAPEPTASAAAQFQSVLTTTEAAEKTGFVKKARRKWRLVPPDRSVNLENRWVDIIDGRVCVTADLCFNAYVAPFCGWAQLSIERGGLGVPGENTDAPRVPMTPEQAQTLLLFANKEAISKFVAWKIARSEVINSWVPSFFVFAKTLLHPTTGFLTANVDLAARAGFDDLVKWKAHCGAMHKWVAEVNLNTLPTVKRGRDPVDPLRSSLDLESPLDNFMIAIRRLESCRPSTGGLVEAIWARDLLLLALPTSNPLREGDLQKLTYYPDNSGSLRQNAAGEWRLFILKSKMKNHTGGAQGNYDQAIHPRVWPHIERYLKDYRKMLGGPRSELVFVSHERNDRLWENLSKRWCVLTRRYVPGSPGSGIHSARHLVASHIIMTLVMAGNGSTEKAIMTAAAALHDLPATIASHYEHLLATWADRARRAATGGVLDRMAPPRFVPMSIEQSLPAS
jgi:hypothetical protein